MSLRISLFPGRRADAESGIFLALIESMDTNLNELELRVLFEISQTMGQALNLNQALVSVLETLAGFLATRRAAIILKDSDTGHLVTAASYGIAPEPQRGEYCLEADSAAQILRTAHPFVVTNGGKEPLSLDQINGRHLDKRSVSYLGTPIFLGDTLAC